MLSKRKLVGALLVLVLSACGPRPAATTAPDAHSDITGGGIITVAQSPAEVEDYLRGLPENVPVADGVTQRVREGTAANVVEADLIDAGSGTVIGLATYNLAAVNEETRITLHLTRMTGLYADLSRQGVLANRIIELLRRDLGDV